MLHEINETLSSRKNDAIPVVHTRVVSGQGGGPEKTILNSPRFLNELGFGSVCIYLRHPGDSGFEIIRQRAADKAAQLIEVDDFGIRDWGVVSRMADSVARYLDGRVARDASSETPFIWHGHDYKSNLIGVLLRKQFPNMRLVTTVHGWALKSLKVRLYYAIDKWCLKRYEHVICVSQGLFEACKKFGVPQSKLSLIDNAIDLCEYQYEPEQACEKRNLGFDPETPLVVAVGRLSQEKGFDLLIAAIVKELKLGGRVQLALAGDGECRDDLQRQIDASGCQDAIKLLGFVADPRSVYRAGDMYVLSSYREGLPNVVLEAMAMRLPVVSTMIDGMPDLVIDGENGLIVPKGSSDELHSAIVNLLADKELAQRISQAGRETVERRFSFSFRMEQVADVYRKMGL